MDTALRVIGVSNPFSFEDVNIEFCMGLSILDECLHLFYSTVDRDSSKIIVPIHEIDWQTFE